MLNMLLKLHLDYFYIKYKTYEQLLIVVNTYATIDISFAENSV